MATQKDIVEELRIAVAAITTTRDPSAKFLPHETNDPFEESALAGVESFDVRVNDGWEITGAFGRAGEKEIEATFSVLLAHAYGTEAERIGYASEDTERIADILEARAWLTVGIQAAWFEGASLDRADPNSWISTLTFRIVYTSEIRS